MRRLIAICLLAIAPFSSLAADHELGDSVFLKDGAEAKNGDEIIDAKLIPIPATMEDIDGDMLSLGKGWVRNSDIMTADEALEFYNDKIQKEPHNVSALRLRSTVFRTKREYSKALEDCNEAVGIDPNDAESFVERGRVFHDKREFDAATKDFTEAIALDPLNPKGFVGRATVWVQNKEFEYKNGLDEPGHERTISDCDEAIRLDPENSMAYCIRGRLFRKTNKEFLALKDFNTAIKLDRRNATAFCYRGYTWYSKGKHKQGLDDVDEALQLNPQLRTAYMTRASIRVLTKQWGDAEADWSEVIRLDPNDSDGHQCRGFCRLCKGDADNGLKDLDEALRLDPQNVRAYCAIALLRATCPDEVYRNGIQAIEFATKANESSSWKDWNHLLLLASAYAETGDFASAVKWAEKSLEFAPQLKRKDVREHLELYRADKPYRLALTKWVQ